MNVKEFSTGLKGVSIQLFNTDMSGNGISGNGMGGNGESEIQLDIDIKEL